MNKSTKVGSAHRKVPEINLGIQVTDANMLRKLMSDVSKLVKDTHGAAIVSFTLALKNEAILPVTLSFNSDGEIESIGTDEKKDIDTDEVEKGEEHDN